MKFLGLLNELMNVKFESLGKHFVDHGNLISVGINMTQFIFFFLMIIFMAILLIIILWRVRINFHLRRLILILRKANLTILKVRLRLLHHNLHRLLLHHWMPTHLNLHLVCIFEILILITLWRLKLEGCRHICPLIILKLQSILIYLHGTSIRCAHFRYLHEILSIHHLTLNVQILCVWLLILKILIAHFLILLYKTHVIQSL